MRDRSLVSLRDLYEDAAVARLTLDQYARVNLALTLARLPPDSVFAAERISVEEWEALKAPIERRLMEADVDDPFQDEYSAASEAAPAGPRRSQSSQAPRSALAPPGPATWPSCE